MTEGHFTIQPEVGQQSLLSAPFTRASEGAADKGPGGERPRSALKVTHSGEAWGGGGRVMRQR